MRDPSDLWNQRLRLLWESHVVSANRKGTTQHDAPPAGESIGGDDRAAARMSAPSEAVLVFLEFLAAEALRSALAECVDECVAEGARHTEPVPNSSGSSRTGRDQ